MVVKYLVLGVLRSMQLQWPAADFDVDAERRRVEAS